MSDRCPTWKLACSTAYRTKNCRCSACRGWNSTRERRRVRNLRLKALDELSDEFVLAVMIDPHYITDFAKAWNRLPARNHRAEKE